MDHNGELRIGGSNFTPRANRPSAIDGERSQRTNITTTVRSKMNEIVTFIEQAEEPVCIQDIISNIEGLNLRCRSVMLLMLRKTNLPNSLVRVEQHQKVKYFHGDQKILDEFTEKPWQEHTKK